MAEGKTKAIYDCQSDSNLVYIESKDRITAGDGVKAHQLKDKSIYSTQTNGAIFEFLNSVGVPTAFVSSVDGNEKAFIAKKCQMVPIEWVTRRVATGSYLKRNPNVREGYRFTPVKLETFFKDDANHDPFWSIDSIREAKFSGTTGDLPLNDGHIDSMLEITVLVFELLERAWMRVNHSLIDMKIEFGFDFKTNSILLADVIDNDSWRLWPNGDKRLMLDKQVYRNLNENLIDEKALESIRSNFELVAQRTEQLFKSLIPTVASPLPKITVDDAPQVGIVMGSASDKPHCEAIATCLNKLGVSRVSLSVASAHKSTEYALQVCAKLNQWRECKCIIAVAGRSNGLGLVLAANATIPVINCPPIHKDMSVASIDVWSSLRTPSNMSCTTVLGVDNAALAAAQIIGNENTFVWSKLRTNQVLNRISIMSEDKLLN